MSAPYCLVSTGRVQSAMGTDGAKNVEPRVQGVLATLMERTSHTILN